MLSEMNLPPTICINPFVLLYTYTHKFASQPKYCNKWEKMVTMGRVDDVTDRM